VFDLIRPIGDQEITSPYRTDISPFSFKMTTENGKDEEGRDTAAGDDVPESMDDATSDENITAPTTRGGQ
jgi:hypothetical protein